MLLISVRERLLIVKTMKGLRMTRHPKGDVLEYH